MALSTVDSTFNLLSQQSGVVSAILVDPKGVPVRTTLNQEDTIRYTNQMGPLMNMARSMVRVMEPTDNLSYVRLRTRKHELMAATENEYTIIIVQDIKDLEKSSEGVRLDGGQWAVGRASREGSTKRKS